MEQSNLLKRMCMHAHTHRHHLIRCYQQILLWEGNYGANDIDFSISKLTRKRKRKGDYKETQGTYQATAKYAYYLDPAYGLYLDTDSITYLKNIFRRQSRKCEQ